MTGNAGEWQTVRKRRGAGKARRQSQGPGPSRQCGGLQDEAPDSQGIKERIQGAVDELRTAEFWDACKKLTRGCLMESLVTGAEEAGDMGASGGAVVTSTEPDCASPDPPSPAADCAGVALDCVCYGLGRFSSCASSRYQLALLLLLLESLQIPASRCYIYDPMFSNAEVGILEDFGMTVLTENEEGKRPAHRPTLFYLIHCGKALYNNLLWKNWSSRSLSQLTVIGNSFRGIEERLLTRDLQRDYKYISDMLGVVREVPFPDSPRYLEVFNDTSVHCFPRRGCVPCRELWDSPAEPDYQEDLEIIRREGGQRR